MKLLRKLLFVFLGLVLLIIFLLIGVNFYLNSNKEEFANKIEEWYATNYHGELIFEELSVNWFGTFPNASFSINNLKLTNNTFPDTENQLITKMENVDVLIALNGVWKGKTDVKGLKLQNGKINLFTNKDSLANFKNLKRKTVKKSVENQNSILDKNFRIDLKNVQFLITQKNFNKKFDLKINDLNTTWKGGTTFLNSKTKLNITVNSLGFNLEKGTYFNGATIDANIESDYDKQKKTIKFLPFIAKIDEQKFEVNGEVKTEGTGSYFFDLKNDKIDYNSTVNLLSQNIQKRLKDFAFEKPFFAHATLHGSFERGSDPVVKIDIETKENLIKIKEKNQFKNVSFQGKFINRISEEMFPKRNTKKDVFLDFKEFSATYKNLPFSAQNCWYKVSEQDSAMAEIHLISHGKTTHLNQVLNNQKFIFTEGNYHFKSDFIGKAADLNSIFRNNQSEMTFGKTKMVYQPSKIEFFIDSINLGINDNLADLRTLQLKIGDSNQRINFTGKVENITGIAFDSLVQTKTSVTARSAELRWENFQSWLKMGSKNKQKADQPLNALLRELYTSFHPNFDIDIDQFYYKDFGANNVTTNLRYMSPTKIQLFNTGFDYKNGSVDLNAQFDVAQNHNTNFSLDFDAKQLDLGDFVKDFDYLGMKSLEKTTKLEGKLTLNSQLNGALNSSGKMDFKKLNGKIKFNLSQAEMENFEPFQKIADLAFEAERFHNVRFAPLENTFTIKNGEVTIPQMQIQSSAFYLYLEGIYSYNKNSHLWASIPLNNLRERNSNIIPKKVPYNQSGSKVFIEITEDAFGFKYSLRLNNKRLYEQKGILNQYTEDKKEERETRREMNQGKREKRRAEKKEN